MLVTSKNQAIDFFYGRQVLCCECCLRKFPYLTTVPKQLQFSYTGFEKKYVLSSNKGF